MIKHQVPIYKENEEKFRFDFVGSMKEIHVSNDKFPDTLNAEYRKSGLILSLPEYNVELYDLNYKENSRKDSQFLDNYDDLLEVPCFISHLYLNNLAKEAHLEFRQIDPNKTVVIPGTTFSSLDKEIGSDHEIIGFTDSPEFNSEEEFIAWQLERTHAPIALNANYQDLDNSHANIVISDFKIEEAQSQVGENLDLNLSTSIHSTYRHNFNAGDWALRIVCDLFTAGIAEILFQATHPNAASISYANLDPRLPFVLENHEYAIHELIIDSYN